MIAYVHIEYSTYQLPKKNVVLKGLSKLRKSIKFLFNILNEILSQAKLNQISKLNSGKWYQEFLFSLFYKELIDFLNSTYTKENFYVFCH